MRAKKIAKIIDKNIPPKLAQDWDNIGFLIGNPNRNVKKILLTIDVTKAVIAEAKRTGAEMIVSYHPVIWDGLKQITSDGPNTVVYELIRSGISVFSIHTALDVVAGGVNDALAEIVGIADAKPIGDHVANPVGDNYKLVVFAPVKYLAKVSNAIFAAGAGAIGNYSHCGFSTEGKGSFLPLDGAKPTIGKKGKLEKIPETRFESIVPAEKIENVIAAMKRAHPYEEPAYDVFKLYNPQSKYGLGRVGKLAKPTPLSKIIQKIKKHTDAKTIGIVGKANRLVRTAAVCAGSCGKIINSVIAEKADCYLTGELKHHQALAAQEAGVTCLCLSHSVSERFVLKRFSNQLQKQLKTIKIGISKKDADPFEWKRI